MLVSSSDRKGQDTAEPCPWRGRLRIGLITQHSPGQGGEVPPAQLLELRVPKSLRDAEASGKALSWRSSLQHLPWESGCQPVPRLPGSHFLATKPIGRAAARARGAGIGWPPLALWGGFPGAAVSARPALPIGLRPPHKAAPCIIQLEVRAEELGPGCKSAPG